MWPVLPGAASLFLPLSVYYIRLQAGLHYFTFSLSHKTSHHVEAASGWSSFRYAPISPLAPFSVNLLSPRNSTLHISWGPIFLSILHWERGWRWSSVVPPLQRAAPFIDSMVTVLLSCGFPAGHGGSELWHWLVTLIWRSGLSDTKLRDIRLITEGDGARWHIRQKQKQMSVYLRATVLTRWPKMVDVSTVNTFSQKNSHHYGK